MNWSLVFQGFFIISSIKRTLLTHTYLVKEPNCEIWSTYSPNESGFRKVEPTKCIATYPAVPVSQIKYKHNHTMAYLVLYKHRLANYSIQGRVDCKFQYISPNANFEYSKPEVIKRKVNLLPGNRIVLVSCQDFITRQKVYKNVHSTMLIDEEVELKLEKSHRGEPERITSSTILPRFGLLMILFDSMSSTSFYRALPEATQYLEKTGWFSLRGHHKVAINTYPNMNIVLTGKFAHNFDDEGRIWPEFRTHNYVTMYAEDMAGETFAWYPGRSDYESYPMMKVLEQELPDKLHVNYAICNGQFPVFNRLMDQVLEFGRTFKGERHFGFFVNAAYTHDDISGPSQLDHPLIRYLKMMDRLNIRNDSIVMIFGDHGLRFGPERMNVEGGREDAMPALFISVPKWMQEMHPEIVKALEVNKNRVTSHYDLHLTLKHIIELNGGIPSYTTLDSCATCQSLFREVPANRSCSEAGIPLGYCYCNVNHLVNSSKHLSDYIIATQKAVDYMNKQLGLHPKGGRCRRIADPKIQYAWKNEGVVVSVFKTNLPIRVFEAAIFLENQTNCIVNGPIMLNPRKIKGCGPESISDFCDCQANGRQNQELWSLIAVLSLFVSNGRFIAETLIS